MCLGVASADGRTILHRRRVPNDRHVPEPPRRADRTRRFHHPVRPSQRVGTGPAEDRRDHGSDLRLLHRLGRPPAPGRIHRGGDRDLRDQPREGPPWRAAGPCLLPLCRNRRLRHRGPCARGRDQATAGRETPGEGSRRSRHARRLARDGGRGRRGRHLRRRPVRSGGPEHLRPIQGVPRSFDGRGGTRRGH